MSDRRETADIHPFPAERLSARPALKQGGGGGSYDGMEPRIARLEAHAEHAQVDLGVLKTDMRDVRDRLARLEEKVSHLPGKGFIVGSLLTGLAVIAALVAFQAQIAAFVGA